MTANSPSFPETIRGALSAQLSEVHVALPGKVVSYDAATQSADVQPLIRRGYQNEDGEREVERLPVVTHVPVVFPGAGAISITWPIPVGSTGIILFSEASIDKWLSEGGDVDPIDDRRFALTDGMFIPGLRPFSDPVPGAGVHNTAVVIQAPLIHAAGTASLALRDELNALIADYNSHTHLGVPHATLTTGPAVPTASTAAGTQKLKGS